MQTRTYELKTIKKNKVFAKHESHIFFHIVGDTIDLHIMLFTDRPNLLHDKLAIIATEIMKDDKDFKLFWVNP